MLPKRYLRAILCASILAAILACRAAGQTNAMSVSEPFLINHNRIFVEMEFVRPDGTSRKALAFVDSGDPGFEFMQPLARELGIERGRGVRARFGRMDLKIPANIETSSEQGETMFAGMKVEANLPARVLAQYDVALDYGKRTLTLGPPGSLKHEGVQVPCAVNATTGLISIRARVAGQEHAFAIDNGSAYTWIDDAITRRWAESNPGWLRGIGAVGDANMNGALPELAGMDMRLPEIDTGSLHLEEVGALGVGPGWDKTMPRFFNWYSKKTPAPVAGFLGGNVLRAFRIEIDYANHATYWSREGEVDPHDLDQVGITIGSAPGGKYIVIGLATRNGTNAVKGVEVNDQLLSVDGVATTGATMGRVLNALHGRPGEKRKLLLERGGKQFVVDAPVTRF
ncbi:MAG TPA: hypothetical protein VJN21_07055 [Candidatus Acidoferrales bacterium]|nr:hypothetical protein [Candidatus Acidoferrales bacterium]